MCKLWFFKFYFARRVLLFLTRITRFDIFLNVCSIECIVCPDEIPQQIAGQDPINEIIFNLSNSYEHARQGFLIILHVRKNDRKPIGLSAVACLVSPCVGRVHSTWG